MFTDHNWVSVDGRLVVSKLPGEPGFKTLSVEELMSAPLAPSRWLVRIVSGGYAAPAWVEEKQNDRCKEGFIRYKAYAARNGTEPALKTKLDQVRWYLHKQLLRWGVII